jgi:hypothetical protein
MRAVWSFVILNISRTVSSYTVQRCPSCGVEFRAQIDTGDISLNIQGPAEIPDDLVTQL